MTKTINALTVTTSAAAADLIAIWRTANSDTRKITKANFLGGALSGGGTVITGGFNLTVGAASTINGSLVGNMTGGGTLATGGNTLTVGGTSTVTGSLVGNISGAGTLATGGFTLTVPATGTASLLGTAQTYSALKTFSAGINLGNTTLSNYLQSTWTPTISQSGVAPTTLTYTSQLGNYTRIGNVVFFGFYVVINAFTLGAGTGNVRMSLPITAGGAAYLTGAASFQGVDLPGTPVSTQYAIDPGNAFATFQIVQDNASLQLVPLSALAAGDTIFASGFYFL